MATKEVITLSSDEESGCVNQSELVHKNTSCNRSIKSFQKATSILQKSNNCTVVKTVTNSTRLMRERIQKKFYEIYHKPLVQSGLKKNEIFIINERSYKKNNNIDKTPEIVDLEDCNNVTDITGNNDVKPYVQVIPDENHSDIKVIEPNENGVVTKEQGYENRQCGQSNTYVHVISFKEGAKVNDSVVKKTEISDDNDNPEIPEFFNQFIEICSSFEKNKNDRRRLIKKLKKRCNGADPKYVDSPKFRSLIDKSKEKINKNNMYLIAKEVTDELSLRKKIEIKNTPSNGEVTNEMGEAMSEENTNSKKKTKLINKIIKKLDKLGSKIRELEEAEVDLSDEEDSSYILVQRYRERFCQIYKKLCEVMNEPADANRVFCRKICFSGSKYPAINQCIEKWLNKTKRFPDFNDIVKLLETHSSSLGLPTNKESIRATATEIFQEVGKMLQRRRKHDLWDSLCGFLNDDKDPALSDPDLDKILKKNFDTRVKKEQEIFRHYAELQEKERLEPEEVPEEEANLSPNESGNEDEEEIENIEKSLNERLDDTIEREQDLMDTDYNLDGVEKAEGLESLLRNSKSSMGVKEVETSTPVKESKNNFKNCKSIKYRSENRSKSNDESSSSKNGFEETNEKKATDESSNDKRMEAKESEKEIEISSEEGLVSDKENSDVDIVSIDSNETETEMPELESFNFSKIPVVKLMRLPDNLNLDSIRVSGNVWMSPKSDKRELTFEDETEAPAKKRKKDSQVLDVDLKNNVEEVFEVHRCEIEHDYVDDIFNWSDDLSEKRRHWDKGKIFRDLTNVGRLMESNGRKRKSPGYFSHSVYHPGFPEFAKFSWKKRFRLMNYKFVGLKDQKCALSQDDKDSKSVGGDGKDSDGKGVENNSESGGDDGSNFFIGGGSGSEKDNDENDENKRSEKTKDFPDDAKHDEDEEDEEDEGETEDETSGKGGKRTEEETLAEDSFTCSTDDQMSSFNESNTTLEMIPDWTATVGKEEEKKMEDRSESDNKKSEENGENLVEMNAGELEENISVGNESVSRRNSEKDEREDSQKPEEPETEMDSDKVDDYQIEEDSNEVDQNAEIREEEEKIEDVEIGEEVEKDENIGEEQGQDVDVNSTENQDEEDHAEVPEERRKGEDAESDEQQEKEKIAEIRDEEEKFDDVETGEKAEREENVDISGEHGRDVNSTENQDNEDHLEVREEEEKDENAETGGQEGNDVDADSTGKQNQEENLETGKAQEKEEEKEEDNKSKESIEQKEEEPSSKKDKPLIRLRSLAEMEARVESRVEPRLIPIMGPRIDSRLEMSLEQRFGLRMEPRMEPRLDQRLEPRAESRAGLIRLEPRGRLRLETRPRLRLEPRPKLSTDLCSSLRLEPRGGLRLEPRTELRAGLGVVEHRMEPRLVGRGEQRFERSPLGCKNKRENVVKKEFNQFNQLNQLNQINQTVETVQTSQRKLSTREESSYHGNQESEIEFLGQKIGKRRKTTRSPTDEERVKKFLMHSPSSISIIPPKKLSLSKPPSQAALQALETLKGLKGISATRVRSRESRPEEDVVVIGESYSRPQTARKSTGGVKRRNDMPVISSVHSIQSPSATGSSKIQCFPGNVAGFHVSIQPTTTTTATASPVPAAAANNRMKNGPPGQPNLSDPSSIRISSVWGSLPQTMVYSRNMQAPGNAESPLPGCSFQKDSSSSGSGGEGGPGSGNKKKKKPVEFVVLE